MSHLDEGTLHALLDGELDRHEVREIQAHLGSCTACDSRLQAAKDVYGEADRLVASIQFPGSLKGPAPAYPDQADAEPAPPRPERRFEARAIPLDAPPQVVILPEEYKWPERRRRWLVAGRWAAVLCVAVGAGYIASEVRTGSGPAAAPFARTTEPDDGPAWVVSTEETTRPEDGAAAAPPPAAPPAADPQRPAPAPARAVTPAPEPQRAQAAKETATNEPPSEERDQAAGLADQAAEEEFGDETPTVPPSDVRAEAAQALAELDRQRRRERAAAATVEIDRARRDTPRPTAAPAGATESAPAPAPAPRTLEQRSGIYLRIGLDEAARQLGRPVHVIEGLSSQFMGLVQGRQSPGADPGRPVVRVVYQDGQGRMMLLDQQRIRPGQTWPSGATQWVVGEIGLLLHGEPGPEVLRNLRPRVR